MLTGDEATVAIKRSMLAGNKAMLAVDDSMLILDY